MNKHSPSLNNMSSLAGKVAIITGASSGIGAATAVQFAKLGALVAITGRNEDNLRSTAQQCKEQSGAEDQSVLIYSTIFVLDEK